VQVPSSSHILYLSQPLLIVHDSTLHCLFSSRAPCSHNQSRLRPSPSTLWGVGISSSSEGARQCESGEGKGVCACCSAGAGGAQLAGGMVAGVRVVGGGRGRKRCGRGCMWKRAECGGVAGRADEGRVAQCAVQVVKGSRRLQRGKEGRWWGL